MSNEQKNNRLERYIDITHKVTLVIMSLGYASAFAGALLGFGMDSPFFIVCKSLMGLGLVGLVIMLCMMGYKAFNK
jgi:hypothetical protein